MCGYAQSQYAVLRVRKKMNIAIIVAGGKGKRMHKRINKLFLLLNKEPIIHHTLKKFQQCKNIDKVILVIRPEDGNKFESIIKANNFDKITKVVDGGIERQDSVYNGIKAVDEAEDDDIILIHNYVYIKKNYTVRKPLKFFRLKNTTQI